MDTGMIPPFAHTQNDLIQHRMLLTDRSISPEELEEGLRKLKTLAPKSQAEIKRLQRRIDTVCAPILDCNNRHLRDAAHHGWNTFTNAAVWLETDACPCHAMHASTRAGTDRFPCPCNQDGDGLISEQEFLAFYRDRERVLLDAYLELCEENEKEMRLTPASLRKGLAALDMKASDEEIHEFVDKLDLNHDGKVEFSEFREVLLLVRDKEGSPARGLRRIGRHPSQVKPVLGCQVPPTNTRAVFDYVRREVHIEHAAGECTPPPDTTGQAKSPLITLISGGIAGAVSRTGTAPVDRLKTIMQVNLCVHLGLGMKDCESGLRCA
jgi:hypothetical protein